MNSRILPSQHNRNLENEFYERKCDEFFLNLLSCEMDVPSEEVVSDEHYLNIVRDIHDINITLNGTDETTDETT